MNTAATELFNALTKYIDSAVSTAVERRKVTPSSLRIAAGFQTVESLVAALKKSGFSISANQLHRYEAGNIDNLRHKTVQIRMNAIAAALNVPFEIYVDSVKTVQK